MVMLFWRSRLAGAVKGPEQRPLGGATVQLGRLNPKERRILGERDSRPAAGAAAGAKGGRWADVTAMPSIPSAAWKLVPKGRRRYRWSGRMRP
jgi:hypothetical protein